MHAVISGLIDRLYSAFPLAASDEIITSKDIVEKSSQTISSVFMLVGIAIGLLIIIFLVIKIKGSMGSAPSKGMTEEAMDRAASAEKKGDWTAAAREYETLGDTARAASMYEKARGFSKAGVLYEGLKQFDKALEMYKRGGDAMRAAALYMRLKKYMEAAKIYKQKGDLIRTAQAFELMGSRLAAAREYTAAGQYLKAAQLYKSEEMFPEAADMFARSIAGEMPNPENLTKFYTYAALLIMAGNIDKAETVYEEISAVDPEFRDVKEKLRLIGIQTGRIKPEDPSAPSAAPSAAPSDVEEETFEAIVEEAPAAAAAPAPSAPKPAPTMEELTAGPDKVMDQGGIDDLFDMMAGAIVAEAKEAEEKAKVEEKAKAEEHAKASAEEEARAKAEIEAFAAAEVAAAEKEARERKEAEAKPKADARPDDSLRAMLSKGALPVDEALRLWMQMMRNVYDKHGSDVYYGCITPESIHIVMGGRVRLDPPGSGVYEYTAPEIATGTAKPDAQSDVYACGVVMYEMLTGSLNGLGQRGPRAKAKDTPEWLDEVVLRATDPDRNARYRDLGELSSIVMRKAADR